MSGAEYDEFALLHENAAEAGLAWSGVPPVRRGFANVGHGRRVSALRWGSGAPQFVLLHGGGHNSHTWDTVALALGTPLVAVDLPGHGYSDWRADHDYSPGTLAADIEAALRTWGGGATTVVGMSLGGLSALALARDAPDLVSRLVLVDILPGTAPARVEPILAFLAGPERFESFEAMLDRTVAFSPNRPVPALRRGVRHNARELEDGSWTWRWDPIRRWRPVGPGGSGGSGRGGRSGGEIAPDFSSLWSAVDAVGAPMMLVRGSASRIVSDEEVSELLRRRPEAIVTTIDGAGHNVQSDRPLDLARLVKDFVST